jgi:hypothetical protein
VFAEIAAARRARPRNFREHPGNTGGTDQFGSRISM